MQKNFLLFFINSHFIIVCFFLLVFSPPLSAQYIEPLVPLFEIAGVSYHVDGLTQVNLLENYMEIKVGQQFSTLKELQEYLLDKQIHLNNKRIFTEGTVVMENLEKKIDGPDLVYVKVKVKDTWNIIVLPYAKYDSNEGFLLSLRGRDYNFLGSMKTLALNLDYLYTEDENHLFSLNGDFSTPFMVWDRDWIMDVDFNIEYEETTGDNYPVYFNLDTALGYYFTLFDEKWRLDINNKYILNDRDSSPDPGEEEIPDDYYIKSGFSVKGPVPTGLSVGRFNINWTPKLSTYLSYVPNGSISEDRQGLYGSFSQSLGWGRIDWTGNFRDGYTVSLSNGNDYNFLYNTYYRKVELDMKFFTSWGWGGLNSRLQGFYLFDEAKNNVGDPLRGILNNRIDNVVAGAYLNLDFPFEMWIWFLSRWFEGHLSPFVDIGVFRYADEADLSSPFWYSAGIEAFAFPLAARSFYLRISAGLDMEAFLDDFSLSEKAPRDNRTRFAFYIGLGHHY
jgi:hypothetical protein